MKGSIPKKRKLWPLLLSAAVLLGGCAGWGGEGAAPSATETPAPSSQTSPRPELCPSPFDPERYARFVQLLTEDPPPTDGGTYFVERHGYEEDNISISYPQLSSDTLAQEVLETLNEALRSAAMERFDLSSFDSPAPYIVLDYRVTEADDLLSVCFEGHTLDRGRSQSFAFAVNLDTETGQPCALEDLFDTDELYDGIREKAFLPVSRSGDDPRFWSEENFYSYGELFRSNANKSQDFFLAQDCVGLILPVSQAMGSYLFLMGSVDLIPEA